MIVQVKFKYDINLDRITFCEHDFDLDELKINFDNGSVLTLTSEYIGDFEKYVSTKDIDSVNK